MLQSRKKLHTFITFNINSHLQKQYSYQRHEIRNHKSTEVVRDQDKTGFSNNNLDIIPNKRLDMKVKLVSWAAVKIKPPNL